MESCKNRGFVGEREVDEGGAGGRRNRGKLCNNSSQLEAKKTGALHKGIAKLKLRYSNALT